MNPEIQQHWPFKGTAPRRIVVKVGSNVLSLPEGGLNVPRIDALCQSVAALKKAGSEVILVSSGAVSAGRGILGLKKRPGEIPQLQAVAAIGQGALMEAWSKCFRTYGLVPAQVLLTRDDMEDRRRYLNARLALQAVLDFGAIPVINENDTVTIDELKFGDNDMLSAILSGNLGADLLVIMSNVRGLMTGHPEQDPTARLIPVVGDIGSDAHALVFSDKSTFGTGGMKTKLLAAQHATHFGVHTVIVDGRNDGILDGIGRGDFEGTLFLPKASRRAGDGWRHWILSRLPKGELIVDDGAQRALIESRKSLLAVGITGSTGDFQKGDVVEIRNQSGQQLAHGIANFDAAQVALIRGKRADMIATVLGEVSYPEVVHKDNLVLVRGEE